MNYRFYLLFVLALTSCININEDVSAIINKNKKEKTISYAVKTKNKALFEVDTILSSYKVEIEKNSNDTIYGYNFKIGKKTSDYLVYHYNNVTYHINNIDKRIVTENKKKDFFKQLILPLISINLNDTIVSVQKLNDNNIIVKKVKTNINEINKVEWNYIFSIDKKQILEKTLRFDFKNTVQFDNWEYKDINYLNQLNIEIEINNFEKDYEVVSFSELKSEKKQERIDFKGIAPNLTGLNLNLSSSFDLSKEKANFILLDFWFMACYPCIKSFPFLNELEKKYDDKNLKVIGVNLKDFEEKKFDILREFVRDKKIKYPIVLNKDNPFKIESFPTVLLLNKDREIIYSQIGYSESNEKKLDSIISSLIF